MSKELTFMGYSDDTALCEFGMVRAPGIYHDDCARGTLRVFRIDADGEAMLVGVQYSPAGTGTWMVGVMQVDEDRALPQWPMKWSSHRYTTRLVVVVPDSATVVLIQPEPQS